MYEHARDVFAATLDEIRSAGTWKEERVIQSPRGPRSRWAAAGC